MGNQEGKGRKESKAKSGREILTAICALFQMNKLEITMSARPIRYMARSVTAARITCINPISVRLREAPPADDGHTT